MKILDQGCLTRSAHDAREAEAKYPLWLSRQHLLNDIGREGISSKGASNLQLQSEHSTRQWYQSCHVERGFRELERINR